MTKQTWRDIRATLEQDIQDGVLEPGYRLPTEPELIKQYGAGRHSVRRAISELAKDGYLSVEQGRGTFVQSRPMIGYTIGDRTRMRPNLDALGIQVTGRLINVERFPATDKIAHYLRIPPLTPIVMTQRLSMADTLPISFSTLYHDATRFGDFPDRRTESGSTSAAYASYGITDYLRGSTEIFARPARLEEAHLLRQHRDMPVMFVRAVDVEIDGTPLSYKRVVWSASRVKFNISHKGTSS